MERDGDRLQEGTKVGIASLHFWSEQHRQIGFLRKNFPATVTSETVKKFSLASNNESCAINALQFIGAIDEEGKRTSKGYDTFLLGDDAFPKAFEGLIRESYKDQLDTRGEDAWTLGRKELIAYFRANDKTSEVIATRQAGVFEMFRGLAGHQHTEAKSVGSSSSKPKPKPKNNKAIVNRKLRRMPLNLRLWRCKLLSIQKAAPKIWPLPFVSRSTFLQTGLRRLTTTSSRAFGLTSSMRSKLAVFESLARSSGDLSVSLVDDHSALSHPFDERNVHPELATVSKKLFDAGHYSQATFEAFKYLNVQVKDISGINESGHKLMMAAFSESNPKIKLTDLKSVSEIDEQSGFRFIFAGAMSAIRNPRGHDINIDPIDRCLDHLSFASVLLRRLEDRKS